MRKDLKNFINFPSYPLKEHIDIVAINSMFFYNYNNNFVYEGETHDSWELMLINSGKHVIKNSGKAFVLEPSQAFLHKPLSYHGTLGPYGYSSASIVSFTCNNSSALNKIAGRILDLNQYECSLFSNIITEGEALFKHDQSSFWFSSTQSTTPKTAAEQVIKNSLELLLISILRSVDDKENTEKSSNNPNVSLLTTKIIDYLQNNYMNEFSLEELSQALSYNPNYLCRIFKEDMGCSIVTYLTRIRVFKAQIMLSQGKIPIKEIAEMTGFSTIQYFNVLFKKYTHMTPLQFRNSIITSNIINNSVFNRFDETLFT